MSVIHEIFFRLLRVCCRYFSFWFYDILENTCACHLQKLFYFYQCDVVVQVPIFSLHNDLQLNAISYMEINFNYQKTMELPAISHIVVLPEIYLQIKIVKIGAHRSSVGGPCHVWWPLVYSKWKYRVFNIPRDLSKSGSSSCYFTVLRSLVAILYQQKYLFKCLKYVSQMIWQTTRPKESSNFMAGSRLS